MSIYRQANGRYIDMTTHLDMPPLSISEKRLQLSTSDYNWLQVASCTTGCNWLPLVAIHYNWFMSMWSYVVIWVPPTHIFVLIKMI